MILFKGDWGINKYGESLQGLCLRHLVCGKNTEDEDVVSDGGCCACGGTCSECKTEAPDEIKGFFALMEWKK